MSGPNLELKLQPKTLETWWHTGKPGTISRGPSRLQRGATGTRLSRAIKDLTSSAYGMVYVWMTTALWLWPLQSWSALSGPFLYPWFTHDCVAKHSSNIIFTFTDDTTILGLIIVGDGRAYRDEVRALSEWCNDSNLCLNIRKTKEMIMDSKGK